MSDARWIDTNSGPGFEDNRPAYDPMKLLVGAQHLLADQGLSLDPTPNQLYEALTVAADLLRALGVRPESEGDQLGRV